MKHKRDLKSSVEWYQKNQQPDVNCQTHTNEKSRFIQLFIRWGWLITGTKCQGKWRHLCLLECSNQDGTTAWAMRIHQREPTELARWNAPPAYSESRTDVLMVPSGPECINWVCSVNHFNNTLCFPVPLCIATNNSKFSLAPSTSKYWKTLS